MIVSSSNQAITSKHSSGGDLVKLIFRKIDPKVDIQLLIEDGQKFEKNQRLLELKGSSSSLVAGERVSLNVAMHLSGIATSTALLVTKLSGSKVKLADTRKTTPGMRWKEDEIY